MRAFFTIARQKQALFALQRGSTLAER
jgi:hypothetical protein